jgi:hypothetical protein
MLDLGIDTSIEEAHERLIREASTDTYANFAACIVAIGNQRIYHGYPPSFILGGMKETL